MPESEGDAMTRRDPWGADTVFESAEGDDDQDFCPDDTAEAVAVRVVPHGR